MYVPIDHCLVSPDVTVTGVSTGSQIGSDHLPLVVTVEVPES
jgi:endonuclease/exonuclease/phosphatase family metal-dependent hydrolase